MSRIIGVTVGTPISTQKIERDLKPVKTINGVAPDENGNVNVSGSGLYTLYVTHNGTDFRSDMTYGEVREAIIEEFPVLGIFHNTATGVIEHLHPELYYEDGEIWFHAAHGDYIYGSGGWVYDDAPASVGSGVYVLKDGEELSDAPAGVNLVISLSDTLIDAEGVGF